MIFLHEFEESPIIIFYFFYNIYFFYFIKLTSISNWKLHTNLELQIICKKKNYKHINYHKYDMERWN